MDPNNLPTPQPVTPGQPLIVITPPPAPPVTTASEPKAESGPNKLLLVLLILLSGIFIVLVAVLMLRNQKTQQTLNTLPNQITKPPLMISPTSPPLINATDVKAVDTGSVEGDLKDIKNDLQGL